MAEQGDAITLTGTLSARNTSGSTRVIEVPSDEHWKLTTYSNTDMITPIGSYQSYSDWDNSRPVPRIGGALDDNAAGGKPILEPGTKFTIINNYESPRAYALFGIVIKKE